MVIDQAKEVLKIEAEGILGLVERVGPEFENAIDMILQSKGRVILTGMGKSGLVGRKIAATFSSTGTPSLFLHPAEAIHGDLGMVARDDIVLAVSNGGRTHEINAILPILKEMGARIIAFTGDPASPMARLCDIVIDVGVEREACPMGLAPTASTTAALAMGDALAVGLMNRRRFGQDDFKRIHPGGGLGERLATRVREVMRTHDRIPMVSMNSTVQEAIEEINAKGIGATLVIDEDQKLAGFISDGDLRRALGMRKDVHEQGIQPIMTPSPKTIDENQTAAEALGLMEFYGITHLVIVDTHHRAKGIIHLHDILGREEFKVNEGFNCTTGSHR